MWRAMLLKSCLTLMVAAYSASAAHSDGRADGRADGKGDGESIRSMMQTEASACPTDAQKAGADLWPMADGFGRQMSRLKGKHPCGQWLVCERTYPSKRWQCRWENDTKGS